MKFAISIVLAIGAMAVMLAQQSGDASAGVPQFTANNELVPPTDYREWIFLSSGLGMTYGPIGESNGTRPQNFDNVFVAPAAYRAFVATGKWPEKTMFVLEVRSSAGKGSINNGGHYQSGRVAYEAEVKDTARFPGSGWAFFSMGEGKTGKMFPRTATCYTCHPANAAVDNTFVQFYPTLLPIAQAKGTLSSAYLNATK